MNEKIGNRTGRSHVTLNLPMVWFFGGIRRVGDPSYKISIKYCRSQSCLSRSSVLKLSDPSRVLKIKHVSLYTKLLSAMRQVLLPGMKG